MQTNVLLPATKIVQPRSAAPRPTLRAVWSPAVGADGRPIPCCFWTSQPASTTVKGIAA